VSAAREQMVWHRTTVSGRPATYGVVADGRPVLFLHGWGLSHRSYRHGLERLVGHGVRVIAPALPGFGGTAPLPEDQLSLAGYAAWVAEFLNELRVDEPVTLVGHSFGGGVALKTAHDHPTRVATLVLVNSIGGSTWTQRGARSRSMLERPVWDWGLHLTAHTLSLRSFTRVLPVIAARRPAERRTASRRPVGTSDGWPGRRTSRPSSRRSSAAGCPW